VLAHVTPLKTAKIGWRDVRATTAKHPADRPLLGPTAFLVRSPLKVEVVSGELVPGGRAEFRVTNLDGTPFIDTKTRLINNDSDPYATIASFTVKGTATAEFTALIDPLAPAGDLPILVGNMASLFDPNTGPYQVMETGFYSDRASTVIKERAPKQLVSGVAQADQAAAVKNGTQLYELSAPTATIIDLQVEQTGQDPDAKTGFWITSRGGRSKERLTQQLGGALTPTLLPVDDTVGKMYLVVGDVGGATPDSDFADASLFGWKVTATHITATAVAEAAGDHGTAAPQEIDLTTGSSAGGPVLISGEILNAAGLPPPPVFPAPDDDVYKITLPSAKRLRIGLTRKNPLGDVTISSDSFATIDKTIAATDNPTALNANTTTTASSATWYIRVKPHPEVWRTSYAIGVVPQ
jgi:hypothetical protein